MRVIAGQWRGRTLGAPSGRNTRPTTDRVKESMFNLIPHRLEGTVIDLFAGSGALGIEALSRGAEVTIFVDKDPRAIRAIRENVSHLSNSPAVWVWHMDWQMALKKLMETEQAIEWVFLDPPYALNLWQSVMESLSNVDVRGGIVCEIPKTTELPMQIGRFVQFKYRIYGDIAICIYVPEA